jgi:hypothetical protein
MSWVLVTQKMKKMQVCMKEDSVLFKEWLEKKGIQRHWSKKEFRAIKV